MQDGAATGRTRTDLHLLSFCCRLACTRASGTRSHLHRSQDHEAEGEQRRRLQHEGGSASDPSAAASRPEQDGTAGDSTGRAPPAHAVRDGVRVLDGVVRPGVLDPGQTRVGPRELRPGRLGHFPPGEGAGLLHVGVGGVGADYPQAAWDGRGGGGPQAWGLIKLRRRLCCFEGDTGADCTRESAFVVGGRQRGRRRAARRTSHAELVSCLREVPRNLTPWILGDLNDLRTARRVVQIPRLLREAG